MPTVEELTAELAKLKADYEALKADHAKATPFKAEAEKWKSDHDTLKAQHEEAMEKAGRLTLSASIQAELTAAGVYDEKKREALTPAVKTRLTKSKGLEIDTEELKLKVKEVAELFAPAAQEEPKAKKTPIPKATEKEFTSWEDRMRADFRGTMQ